MIEIKLEVTIRAADLGMEGKKNWENMIKLALNESLVFSHCDEVKFIDLKEITK